MEILDGEDPPAGWWVGYGPAGGSLVRVFQHKPKIKNKKIQEIHLGGWPLRNDDFFRRNKKLPGALNFEFILDILLNENVKNTPMIIGKLFN